MRFSRKPFHSRDFVIDREKWEKALAAFQERERDAKKSSVVALPDTSDSEVFRSWNDERKFMEELVYKRFTFLLTVFGAILAGAIALKERLPTLLLSLFGLIVCFFLVKSIERAYAKCCFLVAALVTYQYSPALVTSVYFDKDRKDDRLRGREALSLVGRLAPWIVFCTLVLIVLYALSASFLPSAKDWWWWSPPAAAQS